MSEPSNNSLSINSDNAYIYQGSENISGSDPIKMIKQKISELSNIKNLNFLFGAGTSSEAIPTMKQLYSDAFDLINKSRILKSDAKLLFKSIERDNLEDILNILYAKKIYLSGLTRDKKKNSELDSVLSLIKFIQNEMFEKINIDLNSAKASKLLITYKSFYQKVALRNKDLSRINVFTTNNDLLNEKALDSLNYNFNNGFGGGVDRYFNPARFKYTFSIKVDPNLEKFEPLENMVYLYKLHGSINWIESSGNSLFNVQEVPINSNYQKRDNDHVLIYPTPLKQAQSLGSPYSDIIREFQTKLSQPNSALFIIGYSFSDDHLNNIIYQTLSTNASISIIIFGAHEKCPLTKINDSRVYRVFGNNKNNEKIYYFDYIVKELLPNMDENKEKLQLDNFISAIQEAIGGH